MKFLLSISLCLLTLVSVAQIRGKVVRVIDGDTFEMIVSSDDPPKGRTKPFKVRPAGSRVMIRLAGVDCPEINQPYGTVARDSMTSWLLGKDVSVFRRGRSSGNRIVGDVEYGRIGASCHSPSHDLLLTGLAKQDTRFDTSAVFRFCQSQAIEQRQGMWAPQLQIIPTKLSGTPRAVGVAPALR